jgi:hypothetical protein
VVESSSDEAVGEATNELLHPATTSCTSSNGNMTCYCDGKYCCPSVYSCECGPC